MNLLSPHTEAATMNKTERKQERARATRAARDTPVWMQEATLTKVTEKQAARYRRRQYGQLGKAGPCKRIDPVSGQVVGIVKRRRPAQ
jgi:ribosomal protein L39E